MTITTTPSVSPAELAERLATGETTTVLDVRDDASWTIAAPSAVVHRRRAARVLDQPDAVARELADGPVTVVCGRGISARPIAAALRTAGADARVLEGGMRGWLGVLQARVVDVGPSDATVWQVQRPARGCLSYLVAAGGRGLVVDPAPDAGFYLRLAAAHGVKITDVVDTHLHADHLSGARALAAAAGAALRLPVASLERGVTYAGAVVPLSDGDEVRLGPVAVRAVALPGHTTDMTGLLVDGVALLGGDSLFADGIARPDLQRGDPAGARAMARTLHETLHARVLPLGGDVTLLPGHTHPGVLARPVTTTLEAARTSVPELAIVDPDEFADVLLAAMPPRPANYEDVIAANTGERPADSELETGGNSCASR